MLATIQEVALDIMMVNGNFKPTLNGWAILDDCVYGIIFSLSSLMDYRIYLVSS